MIVYRLSFRHPCVSYVLNSTDTAPPHYLLFALIITIQQLPLIHLLLPTLYSVAHWHRWLLRRTASDGLFGVLLEGEVNMD